jgi:hypothetical protein
MVYGQFYAILYKILIFSTGGPGTNSSQMWREDYILEHSAFLWYVLWVEPRVSHMLSLCSTSKAMCLLSQMKNVLPWGRVS